jgi:hypothetical protein
MPRRRRLMGYAARLRVIRAAHGTSDVLPGDFVRLVAGSRLGLVESISGDHAVVSDLGRPGHKEILPCCILKRAVTE